MPADDKHQLALISELIDALVARLGEQLKARPANHMEIVAQIVHLSVLHWAIKTGQDLFLRAR